MTKIPMNTDVECTDGKCGQSVAVIVNPASQSITHFVVEKKGDERLVPTAVVAEAGPDKIRLSINKDEYAQLESFIETRFVVGQAPETGVAYGASYPEAYVLPYTMPTEQIVTEIEVERIPAGELAVHRGMPVEASDGPIGSVGELVVDDDGLHVTHFVLREGHAWGKQSVTLPVSAVSDVGVSAVHLKLSKSEIESLPAIPVSRNYLPGSSKPGELQIIARVFDDPTMADQRRAWISERWGKRTTKIHNVAVLVKHDDGQFEWKESGDYETKEGGAFGAIAGGLVGLLGGPPGVVIGALAGAGLGSVLAKKVDAGFSDDFLRNLNEHMQPGSSAIVVLADSDLVDDMAQGLGGLQGVLLQQPLTDDMVNEFLDTSD